jgi:hypothetical protein
MARTDTAEVQEFLGCAVSAATIARVENRGCVAVDAQGECPK